MFNFFTLLVLKQNRHRLCSFVIEYLIAMVVSAYTTPYLSFLNRYQMLRLCRHRSYSSCLLTTRTLYTCTSKSKETKRNLLRPNDSLTIYPSRGCFHPGASNLTREQLGVDDNKAVTPKHILSSLFSYVWPKEKPHIRRRVLAAMGLLVAAKGINVIVPTIFGKVIDFYGPNSGVLLQEPGTAIVATGVAMIAGYGIARTTASGFNELRNAVFAKVSHDSTRRVARNVFLHLHNLDLRFHLTRRTGGLAKAVDRGTRGINFILSAIIFNIAPTALELSIVTAIMGYRFGPEYALATLGFTGVYAGFTFLTTRWR